MLDGPGRLNVLAPTPPTTSRPVARRVRACVDGWKVGRAKSCRHGLKAYWDWRAARIALQAVGMKAAACAQFSLSVPDVAVLRPLLLYWYGLGPFLLHWVQGSDMKSLCQSDPN